MFFWEEFQFNRNRQNCVLLGTDILCIMLFLNRNSKSQIVSKRMRRNSVFYGIKRLEALLLSLEWHASPSQNCFLAFGSVRLNSPSCR